MPVYVAPFGIVLGALVAAYGLLRPAGELDKERHRKWSDPGWPVTTSIARLPRPAARAAWVLIGLLICAGGVLRLVA